MSDFAIIFLIAVAGGLGFLWGWGFGSGKMETVFIEDDGEGGISAIDDPYLDPDRPGPGDALYPPSE